MCLSACVISKVDVCIDVLFIGPEKSWGKTTANIHFRAREKQQQTTSKNIKWAQALITKKNYKEQQNCVEQEKG